MPIKQKKSILPSFKEMVVAEKRKSQNTRPGDSDVLPAPDAKKEKNAGKYTCSGLFQYLSNRHKYTGACMYLILSLVFPISQMAETTFLILPIPHTAVTTPLTFLVHQSVEPHRWNREC